MPKKTRLTIVKDDVSKMNRFAFPLSAATLSLIGWTVLAQSPLGDDRTLKSTSEKSVESVRLTSASESFKALPTSEALPAGASVVLNVPMVAAPTISTSAVAVTYKLLEVRRWAWEYSPEGKLLESEARTALCSADPKDEESVCSARLLNSVLTELALGRRADDAASAATTYHQLVAALAGIALANETLAVQQKLIDLALEAERLELPDGDPLQLQQQRLKLRDSQIQQTYLAQKLRQELARLTGRPEAEVAFAIPVDPLPIVAPTIDAPIAVAAGVAQRHDLQAIRNLCRGMNKCSLPAARQLLGALSPGTGLSLASLATSGGLFACLKDDPSDDDLAARKRQCEQLRASVSATVRHQTLQAVLDVRLADARLPLVSEQLVIATKRMTDQTEAIKIDKATPGSDLLIEMEAQALKADKLKCQLALAEAIDELVRVTNEPLVEY